MSEFELSTLAVLALLLFAVGAYSYWQVHRAQKAQEARQAELAELAVEPPSQHRYPAYVPEQEPLPETWPSAPASVQSEPTDSPMNSPAIEYHVETPAAATVNPVVQPIQSTLSPATVENEQPESPVTAELEEETLGDHAEISVQTTPDAAHEATHKTEEKIVVELEESTHEAEENDVATIPASVIDEAPPLTDNTADVRLESERVQAALDKMTAATIIPTATAATEESVQNPMENAGAASADSEPDSPSAPMALAQEPYVEEVAQVVLSESPATEPARVMTATAATTPDEIMSAIIAEPPTTGKTVPVTFDLDDEEEKERIAQRITAQEMKRRATWEVFAPFARFEHWLNTAHPQGVDPIRAIDAEIVITVNQPKTAEDIERALYDLRLDTPLPMRLYGARAGQISLESGSKRVWQDLQAGAPYSAIKLTLQLANRSHYAQEEVIQRWFGLAEAVRKRLAGHIDTLPDVYELSDYAQFLHALARRVGQPIILQLHKENGLWPAYEVHQQLTACGAVLSERGIYVARSESSGRNTPVYAVMNDVNNPRAQDFLRSQMAVMYVHTLSFCVELARIELRLDEGTDAQPLEPIQRLISDMKFVADALDAQWQNHVGEEISVDELKKIAHLQTRIFVRQLSELGLPVGALMTKRLLLG